MATMTNEEMQQKKQLLEEKMKEVNSILGELKEAGAIELKDDELDQVTGGRGEYDDVKTISDPDLSQPLIPGKIENDYLSPPKSL